MHLYSYPENNLSPCDFFVSTMRKNTLMLLKQKKSDCSCSQSAGLCVTHSV